MTKAMQTILTTCISGTLSVLLAFGLPVLVRSVKVRRFGLICLTFLILHLTVLGRKTQVEEHNFRLFWSYAQWNLFEMRHQIIQNVIAFIPLGALLCGSFDTMKWWQAVLICFVLSVVIETAQLKWSLGFSELDDVMDNTLGGCIGALLYRILGKNQIPNLGGYEVKG